MSKICSFIVILVVAKRVEFLCKNDSLWILSNKNDFSGRNSLSQSESSLYIIKSISEQAKRCSIFNLILAIPFKIAPIILSHVGYVLG